MLLQATALRCALTVANIAVLQAMLPQSPGLSGKAGSDVERLVPLRSTRPELSELPDAFALRGVSGSSEVVEGVS